jgi:hypothetical protein
MAGASKRESSMRHHGDLYALAAHSGDAAGPFAFDGHAAFKGKAEFGEELNGGIDVFHYDADVVHTLDCHDVSLASNVIYTASIPQSVLHNLGQMPHKLEMIKAFILLIVSNHLT